MGYLNKEDYERRTRSAERRMEKNKSIGALTEEQHDALSEVCKLRHEFHSNPECLWNCYDGEHRYLWSIIYGEPLGLINTALQKAMLPLINFEHEYCDIPDVSWYDDLDESEKDEWEAKAKSFNDTRSNSTLHHTGSSIWMEESWEYHDFINCHQEINDLIEKYLRKIDEEYGTDYAPTGAQRIV